jgi:hypothetical protein
LMAVPSAMSDDRTAGECASRRPSARPARSRAARPQRGFSASPVRRPSPASRCSCRRSGTRSAGPAYGCCGPPYRSRTWGTRARCRSRARCAPSSTAPGDRNRSSPSACWSRRSGKSS